MITLSIVGLIWAVVGLLFVWMIVHYGLSRGKQQDVAKEFEAKEQARADGLELEEEQRAKHLQDDFPQDTNDDRRAS
jgi:predicted DNA-binding WGR domain protein